ncbi:hypothetical protein BpHYR1_022128, partial [Brachionus plicatilis]
ANRFVEYWLTIIPKNGLLDTGLILISNRFHSYYVIESYGSFDWKMVTYHILILRTRNSFILFVTEDETKNKSRISKYSLLKIFRKYIMWVI